jgi:hypothetical protein
MDKTIAETLNSSLNPILERLSLSISRARALTAIGACSDLEDYASDILNYYFDSVLSHLSEAESSFQELTTNLSLSS